MEATQIQVLQLKQLYKINELVQKLIADTEVTLEISNLDKARLMHDSFYEKSDIEINAIIPKRE